MKRKSSAIARNSSKKARGKEQVQPLDCDKIFDPDGDLQLNITEAESNITVTCLVNRATLCLSSPVFRAMLGKNSPFLEGATSTSQDGVLTVNLEEDNIASMKTFLNIIHLQNHIVPDELPFKSIVNMAKLCDKYDLRRSLGTWPQKWVLATHYDVEVKLASEWIFLAWSFRLSDTFKLATRRLLLGVSVNGKTDFDDEGAQELVPEMILERITALRVHYIDDIERKLSNRAGTLVLDSSECHSKTKNEMEKDLCCHLQLGNMRATLPSFGSDSQESDFRKLSLSEARRHLQLFLRDRREFFCSPHFLYSHRKCTGIQQLAEECLSITDDMQGLSFAEIENPEPLPRPK